MPVCLEICPQKPKARAILPQFLNDLTIQEGKLLQKFKDDLIKKRYLVNVIDKTENDHLYTSPMETYEIGNGSLNQKGNNDSDSIYESTQSKGNK